MNTTIGRQDAIRFWALGALAVLLSAGAAFSYLHSMGYGVAAGDLMGLRGREADVAYAQRWATVWLMTAMSCLGVSSLSAALATSTYEEAAWLPRFVTRLLVALAASFVLAVFIGFVFFALVTATHRSIVH
jgi:hypothetical protein